MTLSSPVAGAGHAQAAASHRARHLTSGGLHAISVALGFTALFTWLFGVPILEGSLLAESDMYEQFLPVFLAPFTIWSPYEFGGMPAFADPQDTAFYPLTFFFGRVLGSWSGFIISAFVLAASFTYAYVYSLTRSRAAAVVAGIAFGLSEAMIERLAHVTTIHAVAWLPLMLLCIDRLRERQDFVWIAVGAFAVASCLLGGHPQVVLYLMYACAAYAVAGGAIERATPRAWARLAGALALGVALTAVKVVPLFETAQLTARQGLDFAGFASHANMPAQMLSGLFPSVEHEGREAPTYVGMATLLLALVAALRPFRYWRVAFWVAIVIVAAFIGMGDATPVARLAFELPMYDRFRVGSRHLILACFGLCILAGFGVAALSSATTEARRRLGWAALVLVAAVLAGGAALLAWPAVFDVPDPSAALALQIAVLAVSLLACTVFVRRPYGVVPIGAVAAVLAVDLLLAQPHPVTPAGLEWPRIPASAARPSVHALRLEAEMRPRQQRLLAPAGTQLDAVVPGAFARVWRIPIAGGYGPMLLARHNALAMMGTNGSVEPLTLSDENRALDLLGVRFVVFDETNFASSATFERDGIRWASRPMGVTVGPRECGQSQPRTATYALPGNVDIAAIALVARLRCSEDVPQGIEVARLRLTSTAGASFERALVAGIDIADGMLSDPAVLRRARHQPVRAFGEQPPGSEPWNYLVRFDVPAPVRGDSLRIDVTGTPGWLDIERLSLVEAGGASIPVEAPAFLLTATRWREAAQFATSRVTDRTADEDHAGESRAVVFENLRALPRAWVASEVLPLDEKETYAAVHHSLLPDGRPFEPNRIALVNRGARAAARYPDGPASAAVRSVGDGAFTVEVTTRGGGFLVLGESYYPGWQARIDAGESIPVNLTNVSLQGIEVPPGQHRVRFQLVSQTLRVGAVVSIGAVALLIACAAYGVRGGRRTSS